MVAHYNGIYSSGGREVGVERHNAPQDTSGAAKQALQEQPPGSEFDQQEHPDIEKLVERLNEIREECSNLNVQLYGPPNWYMTHNKPYEGPAYLLRERIRRHLDPLYAEEESIQTTLREIIDAYGVVPVDETGGPFSGTAAKVVSPDKTFAARQG